MSDTFYPNAYAEPEAPWLAKRVPPLVDPDFLPTNVAISCYWIPIIAGVCKFLKTEGAWATASEAEFQQVMGRVNCLEQLFNDAIEASACNSLIPPASCTFDFLDTDNAWVLTTQSYTPPYLGNYVGGVGWEATTATTGSGGLHATDILFEYTSPQHLTEVSYTFDLTKGDTANPIGATTGIILYTAGFGSVVAADHPAFPTIANGRNTRSLVGDFPNVSIVRLLVTSGQANPLSTPGSASILSARFVGLGEPCTP